MVAVPRDSRISESSPSSLSSILFPSPSISLVAGICGRTKGSGGGTQRGWAAARRLQSNAAETSASLARRVLRPPIPCVDRIDSMGIRLQRRKAESFPALGIEVEVKQQAQMLEHRQRANSKRL